MTFWDSERIDQAISHLAEEIGPEYDVSIDFSQKTRVCGEEDGWALQEIVPGSQKTIITIMPTEDHKHD